MTTMKSDAPVLAAIVWCLVSAESGCYVESKGVRKEDLNQEPFMELIREKVVLERGCGVGEVTIFAWKAVFYERLSFLYSVD
jgi:hypothetical protein